MASPKATATAIVAVAIILASVAAYLMYNYLSTKEEEAQKARMQVQSIVVASQEIPFGSRILPEQVKSANWPKADLPAGFAASPDAVVGRLTIARIAPGSPILQSSLAPADTKTGVMSYIVPAGHRAITVGVNEVVGVAGFVLPNSVVDVVATVNTPFQDATDKRISKIVLQNIKVLAVGQILEQKEGKPVKVPTVTLDVTPEQAEKLTLASENKVQLILRNLDDSDEVTTKGATITSLLGGRPPAEAPSGTGTGSAALIGGPTASMEVIKGTAKTTRKFK